MWSILVFAVIGFFIGAAARLLYPGRRSVQIIGTMLIGGIGAVAGGMISWSRWPAAEGEFATGNLIMAAVGAMILIAVWAGIAYKRSLSGYRNASR